MLCPRSPPEVERTARKPLPTDGPQYTTATVADERLMPTRNYQLRVTRPQLRVVTENGYRECVCFKATERHQDR